MTHRTLRPLQKSTSTSILKLLNTDNLCLGSFRGWTPSHCQFIHWSRWEAGPHTQHSRPNVFIKTTGTLCTTPASINKTWTTSNTSGLTSHRGGHCWWNSPKSSTSTAFHWLRKDILKSKTSDLPPHSWSIRQQSSQPFYMLLTFGQPPAGHSKDWKYVTNSVSKMSSKRYGRISEPMSASPPKPTLQVMTP